MSRGVILWLLLLSVGAAAAEPPDATVARELVIVQSTRDFAAASRTAAAAASIVGRGPDRPEVAPDATTGLTLPESACRENAVDYPCYVPRGRVDEAPYASVEWSSAYDGLAKGLYIVVLAAAAPGSAETQRVLASARERFPDAYAKPVKVYAGCLH